MAAKKPAYKVLPVEQVPEVMEYEQAMRVLDFFLTDHKEVFSEYNALVEEANQKLEAASGVIRSKKVSCGDFRVHSTSTKYDIDRLQALLGKEAFMEIGGMAKTQVSWDIDKARLEVAVSAGKIDKEVVDAVRTVSISFRMPKPR